MRRARCPYCRAVAPTTKLVLASRTRPYFCFQCGRESRIDRPWNLSFVTTAFFLGPVRIIEHPWNELALVGGALLAALAGLVVLTHKATLVAIQKHHPNYDV